jgi:hypothetical protein
LEPLNLTNHVFTCRVDAIQSQLLDPHVVVSAGQSMMDVSRPQSVCDCLSTTITIYIGNLAQSSVVIDIGKTVNTMCHSNTCCSIRQIIVSFLIQALMKNFTRSDITRLHGLSGA